MPILKQLVSGSSQKTRRSRSDLTREMISAPLGDFRHTMHVGRSGDAFGDTSFLSTRSGEPPAQTASFPGSPRPGLLSRTFRSSKRSQSTTRVDHPPAVSEGSPTYVKNAMSLPFLNDDVGSPSQSPLKQSGDSVAATANAVHFLELEERRFGEPGELPERWSPPDGGMKHAESVMSFHVDLGPSMLGDILGVMEKEDDDLGYEEGKSSEGRASPPLSAHEDDDRAEKMATSTVEYTEAPPRPEPEGPYTPRYTPEVLPKHLRQADSCSVSSSGSAALDEKAHVYAGDTDSATFSAPPEEESNFSSFLDDDDDDEIRV
ncbi:cdc42 effector protein 4-like [Corythoichthys intestinalis]|uniref:cdc42 effector protein 4-like n=1 Tax=Corythoichthys intestinalis TaxID=161448 RepID=UPI0025A639FB|nr:cdc42 effector protein 4-like [Corythoichthys intestinalis]XP_057673600.1 cdc42 effector protein 4-like [Corythoichthys intestinalis]XP_057673601.1 cdc42 effector protein 4-like [Corythoichthys intestinalis]XP_061805981.1 cdc42 effector protein 4-like [Nerophis lumbriciformis]